MSGIFGQLLGALVGGGAQPQQAEAVGNALQSVLGIGFPSAPPAGQAAAPPVGQPASQPVGGGLGELLEQFTQAGFGEHAQSWVGTGQNLPITAEQVEQVLSNQQVQAMIAQTGLPINVLMPLVAQLLPHAVDRATPNGVIPTTA